jgi:hypothetical protein
MMVDDDAFIQRALGKTSSKSGVDSLTEHNQVIETFSTNRSDEPFGVTVLPW